MPNDGKALCVEAVIVSSVKVFTHAWYSDIPKTNLDGEIGTPNRCFFENVRDYNES